MYPFKPAKALSANVPLELRDIGMIRRNSLERTLQTENSMDKSETIEVEVERTVAMKHL